MKTIKYGITQDLMKQYRKELNANNSVCFGYLMAQLRLTYAHRKVMYTVRPN